MPGLDELLADVPECDYQAIILAIVKKAKRGDVRCAELILDRAYGKSKQFVALAGDPVPIVGMIIEK